MDISNFGDVEITQHHKEHQENIQTFLNAYIGVLRLIGGQPLVEQMHREVKYLTDLGADLGTALSDHYQSTKKEYGF